MRVTVRENMLVLALVALLAGAAPSPLALARQDRAALEKLAAEAGAAAAKAPNDSEAQYRSALAHSYLAEVAIELHDRKGGRAAAEQGMKAGEKAVAIKQI